MVQKKLLGRAFFPEEFSREIGAVGTQVLSEKAQGRVWKSFQEGIVRVLWGIVKTL